LTGRDGLPFAQRDRRISREHVADWNGCLKRFDHARLCVVAGIGASRCIPVHPGVGGCESQTEGRWLGTSRGDRVHSSPPNPVRVLMRRGIRDAELTMGTFRL